MTMPACVTLVCILFLLTGCSEHHQTPWPQTVELKTTLSSLNLDDPQKDMLAHVNKGDYQPVAVCGYACVAPGLADQVNAPNEIMVKYGLRYLRGTSDTGEIDLNKAAAQYAQSYNLALQNWLNQHPNIGGNQPTP